MNTLEIEPTGDSPDFTYEVANENENKYALAILALLIPLYQKYNGKPPDYVIKNITTDSIKLKKELNIQIMKLNQIFETEANIILMNAGILKENISKAKINSKLIADGIKEQKSTINSITAELETGLISKAYYLKNRLSTAIFDVNSNFRTAVRRTKNMIQSGFRTTVYKAQRQAQIFLYNDPMSDWITQNDKDVCNYCAAVEKASPMRLSKMPFWPMHPNCGSRCEIKIRNVDELDLSKEALKLTYHDI